MNRLITFGCSMTYGHGLVDCLLPDNKPGYEPSKFAWPEHLGKLLHKEVINKSKPGASNLEILYHLLNFKFEPDDTVVTLWSFPMRDLSFCLPTSINPMEYDPIGLWINDPTRVKNWLSTHSEHDLVVRSWLNIHHAENYLENNKIRNYSFLVDLDLMGTPPEYLTYQNLSTDNLKVMCAADKALDTYHPGPVAHYKIATWINDRL